MNKMLIDLFTEIYSEASEDVLENIYDIIGTRKRYIKTSKFICEDETNYAVIANMLEDNKTYIKEQFGIDIDK